MSTLKEGKRPAPKAAKSKKKEVLTPTRKSSDNKSLSVLLKSLTFEESKTSTGVKEISPPSGGEEPMNFRSQSQQLKDISPLFNAEQLEKLLKITLPNDSFFINLDSDRTFEFIGGCEKVRREGGSIDDLISMTQLEMDNYTGSKKKYVYDLISNKLWFAEEKKNYEDEVKRLKNNVVTRKGVFKCPLCIKEGRDPNNTETDVFSTRSGDEPLTVFNSCNTCGKKWRF
jgi:DNA-directed RNA polymerase subunit M/transcription elongation factor TFIIS